MLVPDEGLGKGDEGVVNAEAIATESEAEAHVLLVYARSVAESQTDQTEVLVLHAHEK